MALDHEFYDPALRTLEQQARNPVRFLSNAEQDRQLLAQVKARTVRLPLQDSVEALERRVAGHDARESLGRKLLRSCLKDMPSPKDC
jgi:hypothetical protein